MHRRKVGTQLHSRPTSRRDQDQLKHICFSKGLDLSVAMSTASAAAIQH